MKNGEHSQFFSHKDYDCSSHTKADGGGAHLVLCAPEGVVGKAGEKGDGADGYRCWLASQTEIKDQ